MRINRYNRLVIGTAQFGLDYGIANQKGQVSLEEMHSILQSAHAYGINTLDTAIAYGDSETRLGNYNVSNWQVISKLPELQTSHTNIEHDIFQSVYESLERLKIKSLYGLLLHRPLQLVGRFGGEIFSSLQKLKKEGLVQNIGISVHDPNELSQLCPFYKFDMIQAPFNILDRRLLELGWINYCSSHNIELHIRSVFLQGLLLMERKIRNKQFMKWESHWSKLENWLEEASLSALEACLGFVLSFPEISKVLVGIDSINQFEDIVLALKDQPIIAPEELSIKDPMLLDPLAWS